MDQTKGTKGKGDVHGAGRAATHGGINRDKSAGTPRYREDSTLNVMYIYFFFDRESISIIVIRFAGTERAIGYCFRASATPRHRIRRRRSRVELSNRVRFTRDSRRDASRPPRHVTCGEK
ncbi:hypothetical protein EVAR_68666_1 [Eumeta japonica]|uniref:Uncharacterized protein n=1 Tax=Eumeta variegata TaxID=151549 RepID=A0A4C2A2Y7_EUMVA|nr:hypothetical protein EVAR_68666_1 [Eumeta japonica]